MTAVLSPRATKPRMAAGPRAALVYLAIVALAAVFAGLLSPRDPLAINPNNILASPSVQDLLGTDELGRDLLARIIHGGRVSLEVAVSAVFLACAIGIPLGIGIAFCGRRVEAFAMRIIDVFVSLPEIFVAIVILAFAGGGPLGFEADGEFPLWTGRLGIGDTLVLYTDGVTEAFDPENQPFGEQRMLEVLDPRCDARAQAGTLVAAAHAFAGLAPQSDDLTVLTVKLERRG